MVRNPGSRGYRELCPLSEGLAGVPPGWKIEAASRRPGRRATWPSQRHTLAAASQGKVVQPLR
jgi:hypothetical protein